MSVGVGMSRAVISPDGTRLAYVDGGTIGNAWRVPILDDAPTTWAEAEQLTFDRAMTHGVDVSPDGTRLVVSSERSGNPELWVLPSEGGEMLQLTTEPTPDWFPRWSPDGQQVAFYSYRSGNRDLRVVPSRGGAARQLTTYEGTDRYPTWAPNGTEIFFESFRLGIGDIWVVSLDTGEQWPLVQSAALDILPVPSPDGQWVVFRSNRSGQNEVWRVPADGGEAEQLTTTGGHQPRWSKDGREVFFWRDGQFWASTLADRSERLLTNFLGKTGGGGGGAFSSNGEFLYFDWTDDQGDIWIMDIAMEE